MAGEWLPREIIRPSNDEEREAVKTAQRALRMTPTGEMDFATQRGLRGVQYVFGLPLTGVLDRATAEHLDRIRPPSLRE